MAFVALYYESIVHLKDRGGNSTTRSYRQRQSDTAGDISALITAQNGLVTALQGITAAVIVSVRLARVTINDSFALPTSAEAEIEQHALITAPLTDKPNDSATIDVPAPVIGIFNATSGKGANQVDMTDTALVTFLDLFTGLTPDFLVSDGETIVQTGASGKRTHSKSSRG